MLMLLTASLWSPKAEACSKISLDPGQVGSPQQGQVPPGFAIRSEGVFMNPSLSDADGTPIDLEPDGLGQHLVPADLPPGSYLLEDRTFQVALALEVVPPGQWTLQAPEAPLLLTGVAWDQERVAERYTAMCVDYRYRRHTFEESTFQVPAAPQNGWAYRIEDSSNGTVWWLALHEESRETTMRFDLDAKGGLGEDRCLSWGLYDPYGAFHSEGAFPCESRDEAPGCSNTGRGRSGLGIGAMLIVLLIRRRSKTWSSQ